MEEKGSEGLPLAQKRSNDNLDVPDIEKESNSIENKSNSSSQLIKPCAAIYEAFLLWCGISISAYFGSYIRVGISYFRIWKFESNFTVMYAQIIGCFIMGFMTHHKTYFWDRSRFHRILYIALTSGLCGSITTFSTWNMECNKIFYLQLDTSWGNSMGSHNGARIFEWLVCMWVGIALPLSALHLGQHMALFSPKSNVRIACKEKKDAKVSKKSVQYVKSEICLILIYVITTGIVILLPVIFSWVHLTYTAIFGAVGAYLRYILSKLNTKFQDFPIGTFTANVLGTWLLAIWTLLSKFEVDYHRHDLMAVLYGLSTGFCGCLTTVSTFINELDTMKVKSLYKYGLTTYIFAQVGCILIFDIYAYQAVPTDEVLPDTLDFCDTYKNLCRQLLDNIECKEVDRVIYGCNSDDMNTFDGKCICGNLDASLSIAEFIIDSQVEHNIISHLVSVWPTRFDDYDHPTEVFDICLTFENVCKLFLDRINCPQDHRKVNGCDRDNILQYKGKCSCGDMDYSSTHIAELIIDTSLYLRYDLIPYIGYPSLIHINYCVAYNKVCRNLMDHIQCPNSNRNVHGCEDIDNPYSTWIGECSCGDDFDAGNNRVAEDILDSLVKPYWWNLMVRSYDTDLVKFDACGSYQNLCEHFLDSIGCREKDRDVVGCRGSVAYFVGKCVCGRMDISSNRIKELIYNGAVVQEISEILYIPSPVPPYTLVAQSNPYKPLETNNIVE